VRLERLAWDGAQPPTEAALRARLVAEGFGVHCWTDAPGAHYQPHAHDEDETLWVLAGEITFEVAGRAYRLASGDRLQLPAGTVHAATAGSAGATYLIGERAHR
jgi:quercetin dioxygenase-like cupin family protein